MTSAEIYERLIEALSVQGPAPKDTVRELVMQLHLAHLNEKIGMAEGTKSLVSNAIRETAETFSDLLQREARPLSELAAETRTSAADDDS